MTLSIYPTLSDGLDITRRAHMAYVWGWPIVNMINRRAAITQAHQPGHLNGAARRAARPDRHARRLHRALGDLRTCPNQDIVHGLGFFSLEPRGPAVQLARHKIDL
jgi:hypothetical protein